MPSCAVFHNASFTYFVMCLCDCAWLAKEGVLTEKWVAYTVPKIAFIKITLKMSLKMSQNRQKNAFVFH